MVTVERVKSLIRKNDYVGFSVTHARERVVEILVHTSKPEIMMVAKFSEVNGIFGLTEIFPTHVDPKNDILDAIVGNVFDDIFQYQNVEVFRGSKLLPVPEDLR